VRFVDFLKTTVLLSAGAASALAAITVLSAAVKGKTALVGIAVGWWVLAAAIGLWTGRRAGVSTSIGHLLAGAKTSTALPEMRPALTLLNRLWALLMFALVAGALGFLAPQIPGIGAGFALIFTLAWRRQHAAVAAIEDRDGVRFHVKHTSPIRPIELLRTPGFKAVRPEHAPV
jgi:hypothetical protein